MSILVTLLALNFVIFWHELGHFLMARRAGVPIDEFSIGMGPLLGSFKRGETVYALRLLPIGGYVRISGFDPSDSRRTDPSSYVNQSLLNRFSIIIAGPVMNLILGWLLFFGLVLGVGVGVVNPVIQEVLDQSAAFQAGLQVGDQVVSLNRQPIHNVESDIIKPIRALNKDAFVQLGILRDGQAFDVQIQPIIDTDGNPKLGILFGTTFERPSLWRAIPLATQKTVDICKLVFKNLVMIFKGKVAFSEFSGPIGIIQFVSFGWQQGMINFFYIITLISIHLAIINLIPFPVLDGGHLFFLGIEAFSKKPISPAFQARVFQVGAALLIMLMGFVILNDVMQWRSRTQLFQELER